MKTKLLFLDAEMGGIGLEFSLLTAYFATYDENYNLLGELDLRLRPDDGIYHVDGRALAEVNKIDIRSLYSESITYKEGATKLYNYLMSMYGSEPTTMLTPVGSGIKGDITHITDKLVSVGSWDKFVSYRVIDICSVARFFQLMGKLPEDLALGLDSLKDHFGIKVDGNLHEAKTDTLIGVEVYKELRKL